MDGAADASEQPLQTIVQGLNQLGLQVTCCDGVPGTQSTQTCTAAPATAALLHLPLVHLSLLRVQQLRDLWGGTAATGASTT